MVVGINTLHESCRPRLEFRQGDGYKIGEINLVNPCGFTVTYSEGSYVNIKQKGVVFPSLHELVRGRKDVCFVEWSGMNCIEIHKELDFSAVETVHAGKSVRLVRAGFGLARANKFQDIYSAAKDVADRSKTGLRIKCCPIPSVPGLALWYDLPLYAFEPRGGIRN